MTSDWPRIAWRSQRTGEREGVRWNSTRSSHTLSQLGGCFWGCEQTIIWLKSRQEGSRRSFTWNLILREGGQLWTLDLTNFSVISGLWLFWPFFTQSVQDNLSTTAFINRINLTWETAGPELCTSNFWVYVYMFVCVSMCACSYVCQFMAEVWRPHEQHWMQH